MVNMISAMQFVAAVSMLMFSKLRHCSDFQKGMTVNFAKNAHAGWWR